MVSVTAIPTRIGFTAAVWLLQLSSLRRDNAAFTNFVALFPDSVRPASHNLQQLAADDFE
jgi:hypothetical protein